MRQGPGKGPPTLLVCASDKSQVADGIRRAQVSQYRVGQEYTHQIDGQTEAPCGRAVGFSLENPFKVLLLSSHLNFNSSLL